MKHLYFFLLFYGAYFGYSKDVTVEMISLTETVDRSYVSQIPMVKSLTDEENPIVEIINTFILDRFMISSFDSTEIEDFRWYNVNSTWEIKDTILYISFTGEYYGAYLNYVEDEFYFSLNSGNILSFKPLRFHTLFSLNGYLDFLNEYWMEGVKNEFLNAIECAENFEPYCSYYDINYSVKEDELSIFLVDDCYPHVLRACAPIYQHQVKLDLLKQYLNDVGNYVFFESNYFSLSAIDRFLENERLSYKIPNNLFLFGKVENMHSFSMALKINKNTEIDGFYYDENMRKYNLIGQLNQGKIELKEFLKNKQSANWDFTISKEYNSEAFSIYTTNNPDIYFTGKWLNRKKSTNHNIKFLDIKMSFVFDR